MGWSRNMECDCGHRWSVVTVRKSDTWDSACPACGNNSADEALAAPNLNRGAAPVTAIKVPENKTQAIDFAMRTITEDSHVTNMKSSVKEGESAAIEVPMPAGSGFVPYQTAVSMASSDPTQAKNGALVDYLASQPGKTLGSGRQSHMKPVTRSRK